MSIAATLHQALRGSARTGADDATRGTLASTSSPSAAPVPSTLELGAVRWHLATMGQGPGLLLIHGAGASSHSFHSIMPSLAERFTVVAPDLPGLGGSRVGRSFEPSLPNIARELGRLVAALDLRPQVLVGHSAGAALAAQMVLHPAVAAVEPRLVVGIAAALVPLRGLAQVVFPSAAAVLSRSVVPSLIASRMGRSHSIDRILRGTGSALDREGVESYRRLVERPEHVAGVLTMMAHWDLSPLHAALPRLRVPVLLITGDNDRAVPVAQTRAAGARIPRAEVVVIERTGHLVHEEQPQRVSRLILDHLDRSQRKQQPHEDS